jgi:DNA-binding XRE family transcriptional regulator
MVANKNKLMGKIVENGYTQQAFAEAMGMTRQTLALKLNTSKYEFTISESVRAKDLLHLTTEEYLEIFINF